MSGRRQKKRSYTYIKSSSEPIIRFRIKVVFIIFIIVTAVCFFIYMTGTNLGEEEEGSFTATWQEHSVEKETNEKPTNKTNKNDSSPSEAKEDKKNVQNPVPESAAMTPTYFSKCIFVGDSITVGLSDYQVVPMQSVLAEIGMNIEKINTETMQTPYGDLTVLDALTEAAPENIYIMLGSNGIAWLSLDEMIGEYTKFTEGLTEALPDTNIYILSIPPVTEKKEKSDDPILNSSIDEYNSKLLKLADDNGYYYVDINSDLKNEDGKFPEEYAANDGMHFNKSTYDKMIDYILSHVAK